MSKYFFKAGDIVLVKATVIHQHEDDVKVKFEKWGEHYALSTETQMHQAKFEKGDDVIIRGGPARIFNVKAIDGEFAWLFSPIEGFETIELCALERPDPDYVEPEMTSEEGDVLDEEPAQIAAPEVARPRSSSPDDEHQF